MRHWVLRHAPARIAHEAIREPLRTRIDALTAVGRRVDILHLDAELPAFLVAIRGETFPRLATGAGINVDAPTALDKALDEAIFATLSWGASADAILSDVESRDPDVVRRINDHGMYYAAYPEHLARLAPFFAGDVRHTFPSSVTTEHGDKVLAAADPIVVTMARPEDCGAWVVRVIDPELVPIAFGAGGVHYSHHRLAALAGRAVREPALPHFFI